MPEEDAEFTFLPILVSSAVFLTLFFGWLPATFLAEAILVAWDTIMETSSPDLALVIISLFLWFVFVRNASGAAMGCILGVMESLVDDSDEEQEEVVTKPKREIVRVGHGPAQKGNDL